MNFKDRFIGFPEADKSTWLSRLRVWRNEELAATDWAMLSDAPTDKNAWGEYRQALRDLPETTQNPENPDIPNRPNG